MRNAAFLALALALAPLPAAAGGDHESPAVPTVVEQALTDTIRYAVKVTDDNLVGMTITNYGFYGNNFISRSPSLEYPLGYAIEHMVRGGLWFGAEGIDTLGNSYVSVVTGTVDGSQGSGSQSATEFTPAGLDIVERSTLTNSKFYSPQAVSEQDYVCDFRDEPPRLAQGTGEAHVPLNILVHQETYAWSFSDYQHFLILHLAIRNLGTPLKNAWVGWYSELASGAKSRYSTWPPSATGSPLGGWYSKKWVVYEDSVRLFREHYCAQLPLPGSCDLPLVPYWMGIKLLGVKPGDVADTTDKKVTLAAWNYAPGSTLRNTDVKRYAIMSAGTSQDLTAPDLLPQSGDPVELLAVGPFRVINPDSTIEVDFAIVGGSGLDDATEIDRHGRFAQAAYNRHYVVPVPPPSPRFHVVTGDNGLTYYWDNSPEFFSDVTSPLPDNRDFEGYRLYIGEDRLNLHMVAQFDSGGAGTPNDTTGFNTGFGAVRLETPVVIEGDTCYYHYTVSGLKNGFKYFCAVTAYDLGTTEIQSLESGVTQNKTMAIPGPAEGERAGSDKVTVFPNPYRVETRWDQGQQVRDHYLWFMNLPEQCSIRIYTLSGDLVFSTEFNGHAYHGEGARGIYDPQRELDVPPPTLSGRTFGWNLITGEGQAAATGLYLYSIEEHPGGKRTVGKFLVIKSDREAF